MRLAYNRLNGLRIFNIFFDQQLPTFIVFS